MDISCLWMVFAILGGLVVVFNRCCQSDKADTVLSLVVIGVSYITLILSYFFTSILPSTFFAQALSDPEKYWTTLSYDDFFVAFGNYWFTLFFVSGFWLAVIFWVVKGIFIKVQHFIIGHLAANKGDEGSEQVLVIKRNIKACRCLVFLGVIAGISSFLIPRGAMVVENYLYYKVDVTSFSNQEIAAFQKYCDTYESVIIGAEGLSCGAKEAGIAHDYFTKWKSDTHEKWERPAKFKKERGLSDIPIFVLMVWDKGDLGSAKFYARFYYAYRPTASSPEELNEFLNTHLEQMDFREITNRDYDSKPDDQDDTDYTSDWEALRAN